MDADWAPGAEQRSVRLAILRPFEVVVDGEPVDVPGRTARAMLTALALEPGRPVAMSDLVDRIWGERPPADVRPALRNAVAAIRARIPDGPGWRLTVTAAYARLDVEPAAIDLMAARRLAADGRTAAEAGHPHEAAALLREALGLWHGHPAVDPAWPESAELAEERLVLLEDRLDADRAAGRLDPVIDEALRLIVDEPVRERLHLILMQALLAAGRPHEAIAVYHQLSATLADNWGIDPAPELQTLQQSLRAGVADAPPATAGVLMIRLHGLADTARSLSEQARMLDDWTAEIGEYAERFAGHVAAVVGSTVVIHFPDDHDAKRARQAAQAWLLSLGAGRRPSDVGPSGRPGLSGTVVAGPAEAGKVLVNGVPALIGVAFDRGHAALTAARPGELLVLETLTFPPAAPAAPDR